MKLIQIQKYNLPQYASILPDSLLRPFHGEIFVCAEDEIPYGVIALEDLDRHLGINWLWVAPEKRRMKLGSALLNKALQFAIQHKYAALTIAYDPEESWVPVLEYMLSQMGFQLLMSPFTKYRITADTLSASPLMRNYHLKKTRLPRTHALADISPKDTTKLKFQYKEDNNLLLSHSDFSKADRQKTRLLYDKNELKGLTLVNSTNIPGEYELAMVYLNPAYIALAPILFEETAMELLKDSNGFSAIQFTCVVNTSVRLADVLLGKPQSTVKQMCHGILEIPALS